MEPIIAPSTFYWLEVIGNIRTCSGIFFGISITILLFLIIFSLIASAEDYDFKDNFGKIIKRTCVVTTILTIIFGLFRIFIPSQETLIAMTAAKYVTPDNIAAIGGTVEDSVEFITDEIIRIVNSSSSENEQTEENS